MRFKVKDSSVNNWPENTYFPRYGIFVFLLLSLGILIYNIIYADYPNIIFMTLILSVILFFKYKINRRKLPDLKESIREMIPDNTLSSLMDKILKGSPHTEEGSINEKISIMLKDYALSYNIERIVLGLFSEDQINIPGKTLWSFEQSPANMGISKKSDLKIFKCIEDKMKDKSFPILSIDEIPCECQILKKDLECRGIMSLIYLPIQKEESNIGFLIMEFNESKDFINSGQFQNIKMFSQLLNIFLIKCHMHMEILNAEKNAEYANDIKNYFLANMSHEIRTPMNSIIGFAQLLLRTRLNKQQNDYTQKLNSSARSLLGTINNILDLSKIEDKTMELENKEFNLPDMVDNIISMVVPMANKKEIELAVRISNDIPSKIIGDSLRLSQVLFNLVNNSVKYTDTGFVLINIELLAKTSNKITIKFTIKDTGIGIKESQKENLFGSFSQADIGLTRNYDGSGLGLTISKGIINLMGGDISFDSQYEKGTSFYFNLDFMHNEPDKEEKHIISDELKSNRILLVDDQELTRDIIKEHLIFNGFSVDTAESGQECIEMVKDADMIKDPYKIVISDYHMPGLDGIETAIIIKNELLIENQPFYIILSAHSYDALIDKAKSAGIDHYLMKPVNINLLIDTIIQLFDHKDKPNTPKNRIIEKREMDFSKGKYNFLIIEDNELNQDIAREMLRNLGINATIANNGQEGILFLEKEKFDMILMDIQMPGMSGYEATEIIRKNHKKIPIIAMTAHTMRGTREECIKYGMNDYISKPVEIKDLAEMIKKYLNIEDFSVKENDKNAMTTVEISDSIYGIDLESGVKRINNRELYEKLLQDFEKNYKDYYLTIKEKIDNEDYQEAARLCHTIKGIAGNVSAISIFDASRELEFALKNESYEKVEFALDDFLKEYQMTFRSLAQYNEQRINIPNNNQVQKGSSMDPDILLKDLNTLDILLRDNNTEALELLKEIKNKQGSFYEKQFADIERYVDDLDFENASKILHFISKLIAEQFT